MKKREVGFKKTCLLAYASSIGSSEPVRPHSLNKFIAIRVKHQYVLRIKDGGEQTILLVLTGAPDDLTLLTAHGADQRPFVTWLILPNRW